MASHRHSNRTRHVALVLLLSVAVIALLCDIVTCSNHNERDVGRSREGGLRRTLWSKGNYGDDDDDDGKEAKDGKSSKASKGNYGDDDDDDGKEAKDGKSSKASKSNYGDDDDDDGKEAKDGKSSKASKSNYGDDDDDDGKEAKNGKSSKSNHSKKDENSNSDSKSSGSKYNKKWTSVITNAQINTKPRIDNTSPRIDNDGNEKVDSVVDSTHSSESPSKSSTTSPTTEEPTNAHSSERPSKSPTETTTTEEPTNANSSESPTKSPTESPTTEEPTDAHSSESPTKSPTVSPTTEEPTDAHSSESPTKSPTVGPTTKETTDFEFEDVFEDDFFNFTGQFDEARIKRSDSDDEGVRTVQLSHPGSLNECMTYNSTLYKTAIYMADCSTHQKLGLRGKKMGLRGKKMANDDHWEILEAPTESPATEEPADAHIEIEDAVEDAFYNFTGQFDEARIKRSDSDDEEVLTDQLFQLRHKVTQQCIPVNPENPGLPFNCFQYFGMDQANADSINGLVDCDSDFAAAFGMDTTSNALYLKNTGCLDEDIIDPDIMFMTYSQGEAPNEKNVVVWGEKILLDFEEAVKMYNFQTEWTFVDV